MANDAKNRDTGAAPAAGPPAPAPPATRRLALHSLDALRGFMLLMVVLGHLAVPFGVNTPPGWKAIDNSRVYLVAPQENYAFDLWGMSLISACIPVFFMLAGIYAMVAYKKLGAVGFLANRLKMIVLPFAAACVFVVPLTQLAGLFGESWRAEPGTPKADFAASAIKFFTTADFFRWFTLGHLWFLYYLILCYGLFVATAPLWDPLLRSKRFRGIVRATFDSPWRVLVLAIPVGLLKLPSEYMIDTHVGWGAGAFVPRLDILASYYFFFLIGGMLARQPALIPTFWRRWGWNLAVGLLVCLPFTLFLLGLSALTPGQFEQTTRWLRLPQFVFDVARPIVEAGVGSGGGVHLAIVAVYAIYTWLAIFGIFGLFNRVFGARNQTVRYVVDASYWLYLIHFPLVIALTVAVQDIQVPAIVKYLALCVVTLAILFGTFELFVRPTPIGRLLGVRPRMRAKPA